MQPLDIKNILLLLSLRPVQISRPRRPYPRHWKLNQQIPLQPQTLGEQIKKHRLELRWLQTDVAAKIGISSASVSNWERGVISPSRRMKKRIQKFLEYAPAVVPRNRIGDFCCHTCGISEISQERCLFEGICKRFNISRM
jgi:transcriptional regulator with XRE-family HTH domain